MTTDYPTYTASELRAFTLDLYTQGNRSNDRTRKLLSVLVCPEDVRRICEGLEDLAEQNGEVA